jgi:hypothetical protein
MRIYWTGTRLIKENDESPDLAITPDAAKILKNNLDLSVKFFEAHPFLCDIEKASGEKCDRCWSYSLSVGTFLHRPLLCDRCGTIAYRLINYETQGEIKTYAQCLECGWKSLSTASEEVKS